ncbi:putative photosynthetic complex assembly protein [Cognatiyoonia sediminum]|uniref:Putative photosynthetic complex assembly protein n=1 Tax=Cognatiyoonia sediminum TaxID=1508389 RepID=A0A1M5QYM6_9RHOB|nr:photosynthetic complex assembly protein PuhC [Cognatiyoonia sediminum]SHH19202.1 putative photosynthetic complex assembly protein [Cognatiyoonia sediminum]
MSQLEQQMRHRDKEMVPTLLVKAMFGLMLATTGIVAYAQWSGTPDVGVLEAAPIEKSREIVLIGDRSGVYTAQELDGTVLAVSSDSKAGFLGVMGRVVDRERMLQDRSSDAPITVVRRTNGNTAILDETTGMAVELIGYGADNVAAFAQFLD